MTYVYHLTRVVGGVTVVCIYYLLVSSVGFIQNITRNETEEPHSKPRNLLRDGVVTGTVIVGMW